MSKVILTDVDECVLEWSKPFEKWCREVKGYNPPTHLIDEENIEVWLGIEYPETRALIQEFNNNPEIFRNLPAFADALEYIVKLKEEGFKFVAITACAGDRTTIENRTANLNDIFPDTFVAVHCVGLSQSKREILDMYRQAWWVEDKWNHAFAGHEAGHIPFIITRGHNKGFNDPRVRRVNGWEGIYENIHADRRHWDAR